MKLIKDTKLLYRGYEIYGGTYISSGNWVLGGRHFKEGGLKRTYRIQKDGVFSIHPSCLITTLGYAKEMIDELIKKSEEPKLFKEGYVFEVEAYDFDSPEIKKEVETAHREQQTILDRTKLGIKK